MQKILKKNNLKSNLKFNAVKNNYKNKKKILIKTWRLRESNSEHLAHAAKTHPPSHRTKCLLFNIYSF